MTILFPLGLDGPEQTRILSVLLLLFYFDAIMDDDEANREPVTRLRRMRFSPSKANCPLERAEKDLRGAVEAAKAAVGADRAGVVGFCLGGKLALYAATTSASSVGACVNFYGVHPNIEPDYAALSCPVLAFFGKNDDFVPPEAADGVVKAIEGAGGKVEHYSYDTGHAFFNDSRPEAYDEAAAREAWDKTLAFFEANL